MIVMCVTHFSPVLLILFFCLFAMGDNIEPPKFILGVPRSKYAIYGEAQLTGKFKCKNSEKIIQWEQINDDFCDCLDGSDEPGTSACASQGGFFYCPNRGHVGRYIPASRVNDGVCDCCDGSDEYASTAGCVDQCVIEAEVKRRQQAEKIRQVEEGARLKMKMVEEARAALKDRDQALKEIKEQIEQNSKEVLEIKGQLKIVEDAELLAWAEAMKLEDQEKAARFALSSFGADILSSVLMAFARATQAEDLLSEMLEKIATRQDIYSLLIQRQLQSSGKQTTTDDYIEPYEEDDEDIDPEDIDDEGFADSSSNSQFEVPKTSHKTEPDLFAIPERFQSENGHKLRQQLKEISKTLQQAESKLHDETKKDSRDYGRENEFWAIRNECFSAKVQQYTYEVCMYQKAKQIEGSSETSLGKWKGIQYGPADGTGPSEIRILFDEGEYCWNGPNRSALIHLSCGLEHAITSVDEPERCKYEMHFTTPAACSLHHAEEPNFNLFDEVEIEAVPQ